MNNEQFRKLIAANAATLPGDGKTGASPSPSAPGSSSSSALGSRKHAGIPMTPRSVLGRVDFARQLDDERDYGNKQQKKFRTSAPKGIRLGEGYVDRAKARQDHEKQDDKAARIEALEESLKREEIDRPTFEKLRDDIAGGDLASTHLIKGLDFKLLERVRKGEDVYAEKKLGERRSESGPSEEEQTAEEDVDDAFEKLEEKKVTVIAHQRIKKKGQLSTMTLVPGQKRTRDQIIAEMKAAREAAKAKQESILGSHFKKIGAKKEPGIRIERDNRGREVLIIVDEDGHETRKVRKVATDVEKEREAFRPDPKAKVLGMEVPEYYKKKAQEQEDDEEDVKMFSDVDSDYDPLKGIESDEDDSQGPDEDSGKEPKAETADRSTPRESDDGGKTTEGREPRDAGSPAVAKPQHHNYFRSALVSEEIQKAPSLSDPAVLAALKKAKALNAAAKSEEEDKEAARKERLKKMLANSDRDAEDLDMGFGTNRMEDEDDAEDAKVRLSVWGEEGGGGGDGGRSRKSQRKRGPKKRKGDGNNVADVMRVLDQRKGAQS